MVESEAKSMPLTHIHYHLLSWLGTGTSIKNGGVRLDILHIKDAWKQSLSNLNLETGL